MKKKVVDHQEFMRSLQEKNTRDLRRAYTLLVTGLVLLAIGSFTYDAENTLPFWVLFACSLPMLIAGLVISARGAFRNGDLAGRYQDAIGNQGQPSMKR